MTSVRKIEHKDEPFAASITVPGDKSLSHRALLFAGLAEGDSLVSGLGPGRDVAATESALGALGVEIVGEQIRSPGFKRWSEPGEPINCGNSGTTMRLLAGVLSMSAFSVELVGDASLSKRTMTRLEDPLRSLGGIITTSGGHAPLRVGGAEITSPADIAIPMASAQVRTAFELAALACVGSSTIDSPPGFRDHTERWLHAIGRGDWETKTRFRVDPGPIPPARYDIPGDPSSAAFLWTAAAIAPGSTVITPGISLNPGRLGFLQVLDDMGANIEVVVTGSIGGDPVGDVRVGAGRLVGVEMNGELVAATLDELPLVAVLGANAEGVTAVSGAAELRVKESDRINSIAAMLSALGGTIVSKPDGFDIVGTGRLEGGTVDSFGDHRIAMAAAVAGTRARDPIQIRDADAVGVSWPDFYETLESLWS